MGRLGVRIVVTALVFASGLATLPVASAQAQGNPFVTTSVPRNLFALTGTPNPFVTTGAPSSVTQTTATFNGTVNPNDDYLVSCVFDYGTTTDYEIGQVPCTSIPSGGSPVAVSANVSGLSPNTAYHYQLVVSDDYTSYPGGDQPFSTLPNTPTVSTTNATGVSGTTATLNGSVNPNGGAITNCHFDYGLSTSYGSSVPCAQAVGSGATPVAVTAFLSGLTPNTTYHFRVVASNASGPSYGADQTFTTLPNGPAVVTGSASGVSESGATLNGTVNPRGGNIIDCHFDWGTSTAYGQSVPCAQTVGSGTSPVAVSAVLSGLTNHTVYHFRVVATNVGGTGDGADQTFTTGSVPSVSVSAPVVKATGAAFSGTVNPEGLATTVQFEYGLDPKYSDAGPAPQATGGPVVYDQSTAVQQVGSDSVDHPVSASVTGLVPNALYHVRLVASNGAGTVDGPDMTFMTAKAPPPPPPTLGQTANVTPVSGLVFIEPPAGHTGHAIDQAVVKGQAFIPLTQARQVPVGSKIDARRGVLELVDNSGQRRHVQSVHLMGGLFTVTQTKRGVQKGLTTLALNEGLFPGAPTYKSCPSTGKLAHVTGEPRAQSAGVSSKVLQTLRASDHHGKFRTKGRYSAATVRGTDWGVKDQCNGTLTIVHRGTVDVDDFALRKTIVVRAGHSYLAKPAVAKKKTTK